MSCIVNTIYVAILGEPYIYLLTPDRDGGRGYHMRTCHAGRGVADTDQCIVRRVIARPGSWLTRVLHVAILPCSPPS